MKLWNSFPLGAWARIFFHGPFEVNCQVFSRTQLELPFFFPNITVELPTFLPSKPRENSGCVCFKVGEAQTIQLTQTELQVRWNRLGGFGWNCWCPKSGDHQLRLVVEIPLFTGFDTSQVVVWDFSHQQKQLFVFCFFFRGGRKNAHGPYRYKDWCFFFATPNMAFFSVIFWTDRMNLLL